MENAAAEYGGLLSNSYLEPEDEPILTEWINSGFIIMEDVHPDFIDSINPIARNLVVKLTWHAIMIAQQHRRRVAKAKYATRIVRTVSEYEAENQ